MELIHIQSVSRRGEIGKPSSAWQKQAHHISQMSKHPVCRLTLALLMQKKKLEPFANVVDYCKRNNNACNRVDGKKHKKIKCRLRYGKTDTGQ